MRAHTRLLGCALAAVTALPLVGGLPAAGADPTPRVDRPAALDWLVDQQQDDGGFEVARFAGFETSDAALALAASAQTGPGWDVDVARQAVEDVATSGGLTALDALDDWVDDVQEDPAATTEARAQQAAKVIALVAVPLGLDATDLDPSDDTDDPVDLVAALRAAAGPDDEYGTGTFALQAWAAWALAALGEEPPAALVDALAAAQKANGGFDFGGDPSGTAFDIDMTATVVLSLAASGRGADDPVVRRALAGIGLRQTPAGEWAGTFDEGNPNSTALVLLALATLGLDGDSSCWREEAEPRLAGLPHPSPVRSLTRRQHAEGYVTSPNDGFGLNTIATSQALQALAAREGAWPYSPGAVDCTRPGLSDERRLVNGLYVDLLARLSDEPGAAWWEAELSGGTSPAVAARSLTRTSEYGRRSVGRLVQAYLGRPATEQEARSWGPLLVVGARHDVAAAILAGAEYEAYDPGRTAEENLADWTQAMYLDVLGRPASASDVDFVAGQVDAGRSRAVIARRILLSAEGRAAWVRATYTELLRRGVGGADLDYWSEQLRLGRNPEHLVALIAGSAEYRASTSAPA